MIKEFCKRGFGGIGIGNIIGCIISLIIYSTSNRLDSFTVINYVKYTIACSVIGFSFAGASLFFEWERLSLLKATILHFIFLPVVFFLMAAFAEWISFVWYDWIISILSFILIYVIIWLALYFHIKSKINKINKKINS